MGKGICVLQRRKTAENTHKDHKRPQKKAVLPKNCFVILNSKIENSIDCQNTAEKLPELPFNGLSFLVLQTKRKLSYWLHYMQLYHDTLSETLLFLLCYTPAHEHILDFGDIPKYKYFPNNRAYPNRKLCFGNKKQLKHQVQKETDKI